MPATHPYGEDEVFFFHAKGRSKNDSFGNFRTLLSGQPDPEILPAVKQMSECAFPASSDAIFEMWPLRFDRVDMSLGEYMTRKKPFFKAKATISGLLYYA